MEIIGFEGKLINVEVGKSYIITTKGITNVVAGAVTEIQEDNVCVETFDYHHHIKHEYIAEATETIFESPAETKLEMLLKNRYVRVPSETMGNQLLNEIRELGYDGWLEGYPACDMYTAGHYVTYLLQMK